MNSLSSHVLDTTLGKPVANLALTLLCPDGTEIEAMTDNDGRCNSWTDYEFVAGQYCLTFHCEEYLKREHGKAFYPFIDIHFYLEQDGGHYHVPLLISPFGFSSYRGS